MIAANGNGKQMLTTELPFWRHDDEFGMKQLVLIWVRQFRDIFVYPFKSFAIL